MYRLEIDFDHDFQGFGFLGLQFGEQTKESINNYLLRGLMPGGHLEAQFAHDLERALYNADIHNRTVFWAVARWIRDYAPEASQGSYETVRAYCEDKQAQEEFRKECEKKYMWKTLEKS